MAGKLASMGGGGRRGDTEPKSEPNVIPFIDIMLVMLIIFMVTAPIPTVDVRVDLPPPNPVPLPQEQGRKPTFVQLIDNGGELVLTVDGQETTEAELGDAVLRHAIENNWALSPVDIYAEARVFLRADQNTAYGNVIRVMSILQENGFVKVGIFAERAEL